MTPAVGLELVIFDCDGVLVDSEVISNRVLAAMLTEQGLPMTLPQARREYHAVNTKDLDGVGATERLTREHPEVAIVLLTTYADDETIIAALKAGARGYLTKNADRREITQALHSAAAGHTILPPDVTAMLLAGADTTQRAKPSIPAELPDDLTSREAEVLKLLAAGLSNNEIAGELFISEHTVKTHINHIFAKTSSRDRAQAIRYAHEHGLA